MTLLFPSRWRARRMRAAAGIAVLGLALPAGLTTLGGPAAASAAHPAATTDSNCPWLNQSLSVQKRVRMLLSKMTLANKITVVSGPGTSQDGAFLMPAQPSLCIPQMVLADGPLGVGDGNTGVTELPAAVSLAASFDPSLARQYGQLIGNEEWGKGASANLGPTVNIDRDPRWGRSFEAYTEDPFLNAALAVNVIDGVQSQGVMSQVKHFAAYNQETNRNTPADDVIVSDRTLHEIYLPAFQQAVTKAGAASVMCAYSSVNGNFACQNNTLENQILKQRWGFPGFVTSDYGAVHSTDAALDGTDMEQPFNTYFGAPLEQDVQNGTIPVAVLNGMVSRIMTEMFRFGLFNHQPTGTFNSTVTTPAHQALSASTAEEGTVLLKNRGGTLPVSAAHGGNVAVIGPAASVSPTYTGDGSAHVNAPFTVTPLQGLTSAAGPGTHVSYTQGLPADDSLAAVPSSALSPAFSPFPSGGSYTGTLTAPETGTYVLGITNPCLCYTSTTVSVNGTDILNNPGTPPVSTYSAAVQLTAGHAYKIQINGHASAFTWATPSDLAPGISQAVAAAKKASTAVVVVSDDTESEAADRPNLNLPSAQNELISAVTAANPRTVVVIDAGAPVAMPWLGQAAAVVDAWYPGESNGTALASVLYGSTDPSGHLPVTFPRDLSQVPAATPAQFPGVNGEVHYSEGLDVGYRWYDSKDITPLFPFGYGLSYTSFAFSRLHITPARTRGSSPTVQVSAVVTNTGKTAGSEVAQLYLGDPPAAGEPPRQLKGIQKVNLKPGQSATVHFTLDKHDLSYWSDSANGWVVPPGGFQVQVGDSSALAGLPLRGSFTVATGKS
jgi:beta-glucosidase